MKSEFAKKWDSWLDSEEGKKCSDRQTLTDITNQYLTNRLWLAFTAGNKARSSVDAEVDVKTAEVFEEITVIYKKGQREYDFKTAYKTLNEAIEKTGMDFQRHTGDLPKPLLYRIELIKNSRFSD